MIVAEGHTYRTLADEIRVNGQKVYRVKQNGVQVYPEAVGANLIKFSGHIDRSYYCHYEPTAEQANLFDPAFANISGTKQFVGPCSSSYHVKAAFCAAISLTKNNGVLPNVGSGFGWQSISEKPDVYKTTNSSSDIPYIPARPLADNIDLAAVGERIIEHDLWGVGSEGLHYSASNFILKAKCTFSGVPLCGPVHRVQYSYDSYLRKAYIVHRVATPIDQTLDTPSYLDGEPFSGKILTTRFGSSRGYSNRVPGGFGLSLEETADASNGDRTLTHVRVELGRYKWLVRYESERYVGRWVNGSFVVESHTVYTPTNREVGENNWFNIALIPITKIHYIGEYAYAPAGAGTVTDADVLAAEQEE